MNIRQHPEWKELYKQAQGWQHGSEHPHSEVAKILGLDAGTQRYYQEVGRCAKEMLMNDNKCLAAMHGFGYKVLLPGEHMRASHRQARLGVRRLKRACDIVTATDVAALTAGERELNDRYANRLALIAGAMNSGTGALRALLAGRPELSETVAGERPVMVQKK